jgi:hypothetical protein
VRLASGDRVSVRVRAYDGQAWSAPSTSGEIVVGNTPPVIVSVPPRPDATGFFRYDVRAEDPGSDGKLSYGLRTSPEGMKINEESGLVTWRPEVDQAGRHEVVVVVRDPDGSEATQSFSIALVSTEDEAPGPAAAK